MAMIKCPECGKDVSDRAAACPSCACPIGVVSTQPSAEKVQTVEATGKNWKMTQAAGALICICAPLVWAASPGDYMAPLVVFVIGLVVATVGKAGAWWHHG